MKMTIEKIRDMVNQDQKVKATARAEVEALTKKMVDLEAECQAAVDAGNVDGYYAKLQEKEKTAAALHVKKAYLEKINSLLPVSEDAVHEAWRGYVSGYNAKLDKQMAAFKAKRDELNAMYSAMVDLQQNACEMREFLAAVASIPDYEIGRKFKMECLPTMPRSNITWSNDPGLITISGIDCADPDAVYYLACYEQNHNCRISSGYNELEEAVRIQHVVCNQKS